MTIHLLVTAVLALIATVSTSGLWLQRMRAIRAEKLIAEQARLSQAESSRQGFYSRLSHELRTPLSSILGYSELLMSESNLQESTGGGDLGKIRAAGTELLRLVNDLLVMSGIEQDALEEVEAEIFSPVTMLQDVITVLEPLAENYNNTLVLQTLDEPVQVVGDAQMIEHVLLSLLGNVCKLDHDLAIRIGATCAVGDVGENLELRVEVCVQDIDLSAIQAGKACEVDEESTPSELWGILAACKLTHQTGGRVDIDQQATDVRLNLRFPVSEPESDVEPVEETQAAMPFTGRVLVVSENNDLALLMSRMLSHRGFDASLADSGAMGKETAGYSQPDLVLLDLDMSRVPGLVVLHHLKFDSRTAGLPVLACSSYPMRRQALDAGAFAFIEKPIAGNRMDSCLRRFRELQA